MADANPTDPLAALSAWGRQTASEIIGDYLNNNPEVRSTVRAVRLAGYAVAAWAIVAVVRSLDASDDK